MPDETEADPLKLLTGAEAAAYLGGLSPQTLAKWRWEKKQPLPYVKVGRHVRYRRRDLDAFLEACAVRPTVEGEQ